MPLPPPPRSSAGALLAVHAAVLLFGLAGLFGKWIVWPAAAIVLGRTAIAALALAAVCVVRRGGVPRPTLALAGNGVLLAVHWVSFFAAIQASTVAIGLLGYASFPLFVPALERVAGVPLRRDASVQAVLVTAGLVLLVPEVRWEPGALHGLGFGLVSGFTFAWLAVRTRRVAEAGPPDVVALWQNVFAALCVAPIVLFWVHPLPAWSGSVVVQLLVLGLVCTALAHTLFIASLRHVSAGTASVVAALEPVYGMLLALWLLDEVPAALTWAGAALIVAAAVYASRRTLHVQRTDR